MILPSDEWKNIYTARASVQNMGQQMSGPDNSKG